MKTIGYESETSARSRSAQLQGILEAAMRRTFAAYRVELTAPELTAADAASGARGGRRLCLVSTAGLVLVVGTVDTHAKTSELYTLGRALAAGREQLGHEPVIPPVEYRAFLEHAQHILADFGFTVTTSAAKGS